MDVHPDRVADRPPHERARAARTMAELNEAFATLSDPRRRAEYDRRSGPGPTGPGAARAPRTGTAVPPDPRRIHGDGDLVDVVPPGPLAALVGYAPWLALVAVLAGIFVFTAYAGVSDDDDPSTPGGTVAVRDLRGSCVKTSGGFVLVANCAQTPHEGEIVAQASDATLCPEGTEAWEIPQGDVVACTDPATASP